MYGQRSRRVQTDRRDVAALTEACQRGSYRLAHRRSARQHAVPSPRNVRQEVVQARTRAISLARAITRAAGFRVRRGRTATFLTRLDALELPGPMKATLLPLRSVIEVLDDELASADDQFAAMVANDILVKRLTTVPSIGPITATAFVAALDDVSRFTEAGQVTSYRGLVPREYSSGERQYRGRILRSAHPHVQSLLVHAAWRLSRSSSADTAGLRAWALAITRRRGKKVAMVALARRLARILFAMWRDESEYHANRIRTTHVGPEAITRREARAAMSGVAQSGSSSWRSKRACGAWPLLRAVPQRALLLLRISIVRRHRRAPRERV
jgi:transposase